MKRSIFFKTFAGFFLVTLLLSSLILVFSFRTIRQHYLTLLTGELKDLGVTVGVQSLPLVKERRSTDLESLLQRLDRETHRRFTVIAPSGTVLADSENDPQSMENHRTRPEIVRALTGGTGSAIRFSSTMKEDMLYVALPLGEPGRPSAVVRVSMPLRDIDVLLSSLKRHILNSALIIIVVSLLTSLLLSRGLSLPIRKLGLAARAVANGDFDVKIHLDNSDELNELAESFNFMTGRVKTVFAELSHRQKELDTIISSIQEGLFVFDREGKITLANKSFNEIVQNEVCAGQFYWELLRTPHFEQLVRRARETGKNVTEEIEREGRTYLCSITL
ncbi:MAG: HAMP domain-containing protein, partial [Endomicrobiales bacterium]